MTPYDQTHHQPPAPVAFLTLRTLDHAHSVANVMALLDTGSDLTLLPRWAIEQLSLTPQVEEGYTLAWFDGSNRVVESVVLEAHFQGGRFQGRYALIDEPLGIVGRNLLNHFRLLFDGPAKAWNTI
ncbi:MAG: hypothetical protein QM703_04075 [Gemmatales bacterium]